MTTQEFLKALKKKRKRKAAWGLREVTKIRNSDGGYCPITWLCFQEHGKHYALPDWGTAAFVLGLPIDEARNIIDAADYATRKLQKLRRALKDAVGIK